MGHSKYNITSRALRSETFGYATASVDTIFTQQKARKSHDSMSPNGIDKRESRDSEAHPNSIPIVLGLDLTGSMGGIPHELVKEGLPTLMGGLTQNGVPDASLLFVGVGDHECDSYPLQVGQFESGDAELDMWLTRTYIEGGGGGNAGESYLLAWYFAANHTVTDHFEKRKQKGFLFTVGDEPCLKNLPKSAKTDIMGDTARGQTSSDVDLLEDAKKMYNVYHLHVMQGSAGPRSLKYWKGLLGQNCIEINDYKEIAKTISKIVRDNTDPVEVSSTTKPKKDKVSPATEPAEML